jgi:pimeloyl-ACP methyl ester carboxylesterase
MSRVFLIPGLGADSRIYKNIRLDRHEIIPVNWIEPALNDTLADYAQKIISQYNITANSIVVSNSLGGMVAVEIANKVKLDKVIIISSIKSVAEAPGYFSVFRNVPLHKIIPGKLFNSMGFMVKPLFGKMADEDAALFIDMLKNTSPIFARWAMGAILNWKNTTIPDNIYHITGNKDALFPYKRIKGADIVKGGSHIMIFDKADEINKLLNDILAK